MTKKVANHVGNFAYYLTGTVVLPAEGLQEGFHVGYDLAVEQVASCAMRRRSRAASGLPSDDGRALLVQFGQQIHDLFAVLRVEVAGGLIGEDQLRVRNDGAGDGDALLLTSGKLLGKWRARWLIFIRSRIVVDHFFALGGFDAQVDQRQFDVLVDVQFVDQVETLENETDFAFAVQRAIFFLQGSDFLSEQVVFARRQGCPAARGCSTASICRNRTAP